MLLIGAFLQRTTIVQLSTLVCKAFMAPPHYNSCIAGELAGIPIYVFVYILLGVSVATVFLLSRKKDLLLPTVFVIFVMVVTFQTSFNALILYSESERYAGKTLSQKERIRFGSLYDFASGCKRYHPGRHRGQLITEFTDFKKGSGASLRLVLDYFLLPIDIRGVTDYPEDCYIISFKKPPLGIQFKKGDKIAGYDKHNFMVIKAK